MLIQSFKLINFKSIENLDFGLKSYGEGKYKSNTSILVGLNESGKSSILEAIYLWQQRLNNVNYIDYLHKDEDDTNIWLQANFDIEKISFKDKNVFANILNIAAEDVEYLSIKNVQNITWQSSTNASNFVRIIINPSEFPFYKYILNIENNRIESIKDKWNILDEITIDNYKSFIPKEQKILEKKQLESQIGLHFKSLASFKIPQITFWKPNSEYLINTPIDLYNFINNLSISVPLKNIFNISGYKSQDDIKMAIERAIAKPEFKAELQDKLSKNTTKYINNIWKEHKINFKIYIDGSICSVHVEDKDKEYKYYTMKQRSDGFNQFISLILSLSIQNKNEELTNQIILIDEPEIHLHPSGVRYMRDELLKIGKNNHVIIATHSHYMIDTYTPQRHFIISKKQMKTTINPINEQYSLDDDQVLSNAFGINIFKELLPKNILIVEGNDDKNVLSHALHLIQPSFFFSMKSAGGASKVYSIASILINENLDAFFLLDDDKEGKDTKREIINKLKNNVNDNTVFTIRDLLKQKITDNSTLEDLMPIDFVKHFFEKEMNHTFNINSNLPVIFQIKNQDDSLKNHKELLMSKKLKLSEEFINEYNTRKKLENSSPLLVELINLLTEKIQKEPN